MSSQPYWGALTVRWRAIGGHSLLALLLLALLHKGHASSLRVQTIGEAFDPVSNEPLYSETHCVSPNALIRKVLYRNPQDQLIAHKELNYESGPMIPSFEQHNLDEGDTVAIELQRDKVVMTSTEGNGEVRIASLSPGAQSPIVIDAGFDAFVTGNWDTLVAGQGKRFQFPVAAREMLVELSIESVPCSYNTGTDQCFRLEPDNWFIRMLADPIELGYDARLQRLSRFRGVSNISDGSGSGLLVDIHYRYDGLAALQCAN